MKEINLNEKVFYNQCEDDDWYEVDDEWSYNCPCDTYGPTACSTSCPRYFECQN